MQTFNIDIAQSPAPLVLYAKQGDSLSRFFQINFLESGQPWAPPAGALFAVRYGTPGLPSGWYDTITEPDGSSHSAFGLLGNVLTVEIAYEAVSVSGRNALCVLVLDANGYQLGAWNLALQVEITPGENAPESAQYYSLLSAQVAQVLASVTDAENAATLAESWAVGGTGTRTGEDTNNAKYWADQAAASAGQSLGFRTFSKAVSPDPVSGDVDPTSPMLMSSLTVTSAVNRLDHVVIPGKTTQAGSGDPSPANIRALSGVGKQRIKQTFSSSAGWNLASTIPNFFYTNTVSSIIQPPQSNATIANIVSSYYKPASRSAITSSPQSICVQIDGQIGIYDPTVDTVQALGEKFAANPLTVWFIPKNSSDATGWYTYAAVSGNTYAAVGLELDGPLFDGDSINNNAETSSGRRCAVYRVNGFVTVDGTDTPFTQGTDGYSIALPGAADGPVTACNIFTGLTISGGVCTIPASAFPSSVTSLETANQWAAQNPVQLLYPLATPTTTYSAAQPLVNSAGTWTLSAENTPQGYMRALCDATQIAGQAINWYMPPGAILPYAGSTAPAGWLLCDGSTVSRTTYAALFAVIGETFGAGDGSATFALPDMRGNVAAGANTSHALASTAGAETITQTVEQMPAHTHSVQNVYQYVETGGDGGRTDSTTSKIATIATSSTGGGQPMSVMQPTLYLNYIIKY